MLTLCVSFCTEFVFSRNILRVSGENVNYDRRDLKLYVKLFVQEP